MRLQLTIALFCLTIAICKSQPNDKNIWLRFEDTIQQLYGFKDLQGNIKVTPQYWDCPTDTFRTIAFVGIEKEGWVCINKKLNKLFHPYIWDNGIDYWQSGLIRIKENNKIGFADTTGKIVIPPIYDFATPFDKDFSAFLSGGKYSCLEKEVPDSMCEHMGWVGGLWGIINKHNDTIVSPTINDSILMLSDLNISSLTDNKPNSAYLPLAGKGKTYYIEDIRKSFQNFFENFLKQVENKNTSYFLSISLKNVKCTYCLLNTKQEYDSLVKAKLYFPGNFYTEIRSNEVFLTQKFIEEDLSLVFSKQAISYLRDTSITAYFIEHDYCNYLFTFDNDNLFLQDLNKQQRYYKITAVVSHYKTKEISYQEHYEFLKTEKGIKFIGYDRTLDGYGE